MMDVRDRFNRLKDEIARRRRRHRPVRQLRNKLHNVLHQQLREEVKVERIERDRHETKMKTLWAAQLPLDLPAPKVAQEEKRP